jgi:TonB family protein
MVTIGTKGYVLVRKISQSSGNPSLDLAALSAAKKFRYRAAMNGLGQLSVSLTAIPFNFQLR